ncbi:MAG: hypothetical protein K0S08_127 [Gammaproteobacteria bacterium]|jgi:hypothetical protein|nr:hypothetical protein [Gammaproteobacteria bacterium]MCE3239421.1 hypothetical protein [Gammaproteobacteria bacterium]
MFKINKQMMIFFTLFMYGINNAQAETETPPLQKIHFLAGQKLRFALLDGKVCIAKYGYPKLAAVTNKRNPSYEVVLNGRCSYPSDSRVFSLQGMATLENKNYRNSVKQKAPLSASYDILIRNIATNKIAASTESGRDQHLIGNASFLFDSVPRD